MVVTNVGALPETVQHNKTGIVVKPCDVNDLANGIMELHSDKKKLNAMRNNIKKEWMKDMSWEPIADEYLKCYEKNDAAFQTWPLTARDRSLFNPHYSICIIEFA